MRTMVNLDLVHFIMPSKNGMVRVELGESGLTMRPSDLALYSGHLLESDVDAMHAKMLAHEKENK